MCAIRCLSTKEKPMPLSIAFPMFRLGTKLAIKGYSFGLWLEDYAVNNCKALETILFAD